MPSPAPELIFAVVAPTGTDVGLVTLKLIEALQTVYYSAEEVHLSWLLRDVENAPWVLEDHPEQRRLESYMDAGDSLCEGIGRTDAMVYLALREIENRRINALKQELGDALVQEMGPDLTAEVWRAELLRFRRARRHAYILRSLKRPQEVETLRALYGPWFFLVAASAVEGDREEGLAAKIGADNPLLDESDRRRIANELINRDRSAAAQVNPFGQNVGRTFPEADLFVRTHDEGELSLAILRFIELLFGNRFHTPSRDEYAMCQAQMNACRSADLSRQVGAVIVRQGAAGDESIVAMGTNEVPRAGGGPYWEGDSEDARDFRQHGDQDPSNVRRNRLLADLLKLLGNAHLKQETADRVSDPLIGPLVDELWNGPLDGALLRDIIEFQRAVHAEMGALCDAAARGVPVEGGTAFTTTFPCHLCAKHLVSAGLKKVVFIEPYPKSLVNEFYPDSVALEADPDGVARMVLIAFEGLAPRRYFEFFSLGRRERSTGDGSIVAWEANKESAIPAVGTPRTDQPPLVAFALAEAQLQQELATRLAEAVAGWAKN